MRRRPLIVYVLYLAALGLALPGFAILLVLGASWRARGLGTLNAGDLALALPPLTIALAAIVLALVLWALAAIIRELRAIRATSAGAPSRPAFAPVHPAAPRLGDPVATTAVEGGAPRESVRA